MYQHANESTLVLYVQAPQAHKTFREKIFVEQEQQGVIMPPMVIQTS